MMQLWGHPDCEACVQTEEWLGRTPLEWTLVNVGDLNPPFEGEIPRLVLEGGKNIIGIVAIKQFAKQELEKMGMRPIDFGIN